ncbi:MAG: GNAT family N-acetyltransferase [Acidimicrobiales bacterium]
MPALRGRSVLLRPETPADAPELAAIRTRPEVLRWWGPPDAPDDAIRYVVELEDRVIGAIEYHEQRSPQHSWAGIDVYLDPEVHRRGLGTDAVRTLAVHLVRDRGHHRLTIDPSADNAVAIACYRRVGFRPVGVLRRYETVWWEDGRRRDGLLMDLLAEELVP